MIESFERLVTEATREQWSCTDFLDAILQAETDFRIERKTKRRIKAANFALRPSFDDFDLTATVRSRKHMSRISAVYTGWPMPGRFC